LVLGGFSAGVEVKCSSGRVGGCWSKADTMANAGLPERCWEASLQGRESNKAVQQQQRDECGVRELAVPWGALGQALGAGRLFCSGGKMESSAAKAGI
jgi:hypothetical protein